VKTTLRLPDFYHKKLRKVAIDRSLTMAELICQAIREKFFSTDEPVPGKIQGILKDRPSTEKEIKNLKRLWLHVK
jgi:hypothetical protein